MDLGKKTPWHLAINGGLVPVLELPNGTVINESKVLMEYVEDAYPESGYSLLPSDPVLRAKMRIAIPLVDNFNSSWWPILFKKSYAEEDFAKLKVNLQKIEDFIVANGRDDSPFA